MIVFIFNKTFRLLTENVHLLMGDHEKSLLNQVEIDRCHYKHINFYALDAEQQINDKLTMIKHYFDDISQLSSRLQQITPTSTEITHFIHELSSILGSLESKKIKLIRLKAKIPDGVLDAKRALYAADHALLSDSPEENIALKNHFVALKELMSNSNKSYNRIIKQGGTVNFILYETTMLYWKKLSEYRSQLLLIMDHINQCTQLTKTGQLVQRCLQNAIQQTPSGAETNRALRLLVKTTPHQMHRNHWMNEIGLYSIDGRRACQFLKKTDKPFFYMPDSDQMQHIDYDPECDLADLGGNCFGEAVLFMHDLSLGRFKRLCPEAGIINFQLDQTLTLPFQKILLGQAETEVSADSRHQSLQWEDVQPLILENPDFKPGDICGIFLAVNEYTQAKTAFSPGHIAVIAKLDTTLSPYKYIVFEKAIGVFGLVDDESLEYIVRQHIMAMYAGMHYSRMYFTKYGEASLATYQFVSKINPITPDSPPGKRLEAPNVGSFFEADKHLSSPGDQTLVVSAIKPREPVVPAKA